jgi:hypothetical protein
VDSSLSIGNKPNHSKPEKENEMSKIRFIVFISALSIPVLIFAISYSIIGVFASDSDSLPQRAAVQGANEAGMKIYWQSERAGYGRVPARIIAEGMAIYHASERAQGVFPGANEAGLKIYQQSEWADYRRVPSSSNEAGLAIYRQSERSAYSVGPSFSNEEGLAIYFESERNWGSFPGANEAGLKIYRQSERADYRRVPSSSNEAGLAIYRESERNSAAVEPAVSNEKGLEIYHESERVGVEP